MSLQFERRAGVPARFQTQPFHLSVPCQQPCAPSCSQTRQWPSGQPAAAAFTMPSAAAAVRVRDRHRSVTTCAWFGQQPSRKLWDYQGSCVWQLSLQELQLLHRLSFGHRNQRSYLIIIHTPDSPACQAFEQEVERLASGLAHERAFVVAALDASSQLAARFASDMLGVSRLPAVLLYPEAARGFLRLQGGDLSAPGMLAAINKARVAAWPPSASSPGAREWQLLEPATPLAVTALRAAAASGDQETVVATLQQQMAPIELTPLPVVKTSTFWSRGRLMLWGGMLLVSLAMLAWDMVLADAWEDWCLQRRQAARARGRRFSLQENMDDLTVVMMKGVQQQMRRAAGQPPLVEAEQAEQLDKQQFLQAGRLIEELRASGGQQQQQQQQTGAQGEIQMTQQESGGWAAEDAASSKPRTKSL